MKIEIKRYTNEVVAVINDHYNLGLGNLLNKTDDELKVIAETRIWIKDLGLLRSF